MSDIEYINQWVLVKLDDRLAKAWEHHSGTHFAGFVYVDSQAGMSMDVAIVCDGQPDGSLVRVGGPVDMNIGLKLRYGMWNNPEPALLSAEQRQALGLPEIPDWLSHYDDGRMNELRGLRFLDGLRAPGFPDDIKFPLIRQGMQIEQVWGRLITRLPEDVYVLKLLNQPNQNFGVKAGDVVQVRIRLLPDGKMAMSFLGKWTAS